MTVLWKCDRCGEMAVSEVLALVARPEGWMHLEMSPLPEDLGPSDLCARCAGFVVDILHGQVPIDLS